MILALLLACAPEPPPPVDPPAVVVIVSDTVRADLGGLDAPAWLAGGRRYSLAYSAAPYTTASTATLVTGRYPVDAERGWPGGGPPPCGDEDRRPPQRVPWPADAWPDLLLMDQPVPAMMAGLPIQPFDGPGSEDLFAAAVAALDDGRRAIYVHSVGAHDPYDGAIDGRRSPAAQALHRAVACGTAPSPEVAAWAGLAYPWAVRRSVVGLPELIRVALAVGATVIFTADHGEALGEDGRWGHATDLHDPQIHVPLIVWGPGVEEGVDDTPVPATCVGQTARKILGETGDLCDLRDGYIVGDVVAGTLLADGVWDERIILSPR